MAARAAEPTPASPFRQTSNQISPPLPTLEGRPAAESLPPPMEVYPPPEHIPGGHMQLPGDEYMYPELMGTPGETSPECCDFEPGVLGKLFSKLHAKNCNGPECCDDCSPWERFTKCLRSPPTSDIGVGHERVMLAPFEIETTQPFNNIRFRVDSAYNHEKPDRSEFFWAKYGALGGLGPPLIEESVDYQELHFINEVGGDSFSVTTDVPIRIVDPEINANTAGLSDMSIATKAVLLDGELWQITQFTRTFLKTGDDDRGLSSGHASIEPGLLARYQWTPETYLHSQLTYWVPLGGDPEHSGQVLKYGLGISHLYYETDDIAIIPTLEFVGWSALDGRETPFPAGPPQEVDPVGIFNIHPGIRLVHDTGGDCGLREIGIGTAFAASSEHWYESRLTFEIRWSY